MVAASVGWARVLKSTLLLCSAVAVCSNANAQSFDSRQVQVYQVGYEGSGCPQGTVQAVLAPDASSLSILYDAFQVRAGGNTGVETENGRCTVEVKMKIPRFWSVNIESVDVRGFVSLPHGMVGQQDIKVISGFNNPLSLSFGVQTWRGPVEQNYVSRSAKPFEGPQWLSCLPPKDKTKVEVRTRVKVEGGRADREGLMTVDSVDGRMIQRYRLAWKNCLTDPSNSRGTIEGGGISIPLPIPFPFPRF